MGWSTGRRSMSGRVGNDERVVEGNFHDAAFAVLNATADVSEVVRRGDIIDGVGEIVAKFSSEVKKTRRNKQPNIVRILEKIDVKNVGGRIPQHQVILCLHCCVSSHNNRLAAVNLHIGRFK